MFLNRRKVSRRAVAVLALVAGAGWLLPSFFSAERYRRRLESGLERALHRPVAFGSISFRLLPRPGFFVQNVVISEDPAFGSEPLARVDRIECDLRWRSLWRSRLDVARLRLEHASLNFVRNDQGEWSVGRLLHVSGIASPAELQPAQESRSPGNVVLEADDARINFTVGSNKKPFALTDLRARLELDSGRGLLKYRIAANPLRTDLSLPSPGSLELEGDWRPGKDLDGPLNATLRTRDSLLYDWIPLVTGRSPQIYGVLDAEIHLAGSVRALKVDGQCHLGQLHPSEQIPSSEPASLTFHFRGGFDRDRGRATLESVEAAFSDSRFHLTGSIDNIPHSPELDLVLALERSRLEDLLSLGRSFGAKPGAFGVSGRVDGLLAVQGPWSERRYGGFMSAREVRLRTSSGTFPVSEIVVRIDRSGARLAPARVTLAPHVELVAEGVIDRHAPPDKKRTAGLLRYDLALSAKAIPLGDLVRFGRALGIRAAQGLDAQGVGTAAFHLTGSAWPPARPALTGRAELRAARFFIPGLTEPLNLPGARLEVNGDRIIADHIVAVMGTSVFTGRLEHQGDQTRPWEFDLRANGLSVEQGALWFDVLGLRKPAPLLERLPGLGSPADRRLLASNLFGALNVKGRFSAPAVTYRALTLRDFRAAIEISGRRFRITDSTFKAGGGRGQGRAQVDLTRAPAAATADVQLANGNLQAFVPRLPAALRRLRGAYSISGHFETRGLTRLEMRDNLLGEATVRLKNVFLGDFDPLQAIARNAGWGSLDAASGEASLRAARASLRVRDRTVFFEKNSLDFAGANLKLAGAYGFDGVLDLDLAADLRAVRRRWLDGGEESGAVQPFGSLHLAGSFDRLVVTPGVEVSRTVPRRQERENVSH